jgi:hypothetical protein
MLDCFRRYSARFFENASLKEKPVQRCGLPFRPGYAFAGSLRRKAPSNWLLRVATSSRITWSLKRATNSISPGVQASPRPAPNRLIASCVILIGHDKDAAPGTVAPQFDGVTFQGQLSSLQLGSSWRGFGCLPLEHRGTLWLRASSA